MTLWFVLALMTGAAMVAVAWPLTGRTACPRSGSDLAVYRDQLDEIGRDQAAGRIGDSEAEAAQVEVSRRLLAAADAEAAAAARSGGRGRTAPARGRYRGAAGGVVRQSRRSISRSARRRCPASRWRRARQGQSIEALIAQVEGHLARNPNDGRGWEVMAPIYLRLGRVEDAVKARRNALAFSGETSERQSGLGEALAAASDGE